MTAQAHKNKKVTTLSMSKGFTLIELLVVIGILAVLLSITLIAINPARQFAQANNTKRSSDVNAILNAIGQYMASNSGNLPGSLSLANCPAATPCPIANTSTGGNLCAALTTAYLAALPQDPSSNNGAPITNCTTYDTGYEVYISAANNRVTVSAPDTDTTLTPGNAIISVTR